MRPFEESLDRSLYSSLIPSTQSWRLGFVVRDLLKVLTPGDRVKDHSQRKSASASRYTSSAGMPSTSPDLSSLARVDASDRQSSSSS